MALPKPSTGASNIYAAPPSDSEISPTTSPAASSKPEDSDPNYTLNYEEPLYLASLCVPVRDVSGEVGFEALEGLPVLAAEEFVLEVSEDLFGGAIVDAVTFA